MAVNYFLYVVTTDCEEENIKKGEDGWGYCNFSPGIMDAPYGIMYVVSASYVDSKIPPRTNSKTKGDAVKAAIYLYYGLKDEPN